MIRLIKSLLAGGDERAKTAGVRRSSRWPAVRKAHLAANPACAACGVREALEVHHCLPFHLHPELELDPANLLTLCESKSHNCHLLFGHCLGWSRYNPTVRGDAARCLEMIRDARP